MKIVHKVIEVRNIVKGVDGSIAFVPTMGALHKGHIQLIKQAKQEADFVVVSSYVNPTQFDSKDDLLNYPRQDEQDQTLCEQEGVDLFFAPDTKEIYGETAPLISISVKNLGDVLCGKSRPGHFSGVLQVVTRLFNIVQPTVALFGEKDYQQLLIIKQLVKDLHFPINIIAVPTTREEDGLAVSSRNSRLSLREREMAPILYKTLQWIRSKAETARFDRRALPVEWVEEEAKKWLKTHEPDVEIDYIEVRNNDDLSKGQFLSSNSRAFGAVRIGSVRLIDNISLD